MSSCVNNCGKPCCEAPPKVFYTKCVGPCHCRISTIHYCKKWSHLHDGTQFYQVKATQLCSEKVTCIYVCERCIHLLQSFTSGDLYIWIGFTDRSYTIWKGRRP